MLSCVIVLHLPIYLGILDTRDSMKILWEVGVPTSAGLEVGRDEKGHFLCSHRRTFCIAGSGGSPIEGDKRESRAVIAD